ncbi:MAG: hypothetical protein Ct9H90mP16_17390 [Candidatus Poseidoniales archaeon]|nr:MAG: hypothetical protein Ct9H90mP16_17390 [Candidatus Poseidoniales archaeon]
MLHAKAAKPLSTNKVVKEGKFESTGRSLPSQTDWSVQGKALVTDVPITYLGYVNRDTGVIEEPGHPLDGIAISDTILIYPKGVVQPSRRLFSWASYTLEWDLVQSSTVMSAH